MSSDRKRDRLWVSSLWRRGKNSVEFHQLKCNSSKIWRAEKWGAESFYNRLPLPTLLHAEYNAKLREYHQYHIFT